jgi:hypothetical protein
MLFREMVQALHDFWFDRLTDLERHESDVLRWADLIEAKTHASPRTIGFLDGTWLQTCERGGPDMIQRQLYKIYFGTTEVMAGNGKRYDALRLA